MSEGILGGDHSALGVITDPAFQHERAHHVRNIVVLPSMLDHHGADKFGLTDHLEATVGAVDRYEFGRQ